MKDNLVNKSGDLVNDLVNDCISRQAALDALGDIDCSDGVGFRALKYDAINDAITAIKALPPAQPETHDKRTETHACDLISRATAINAFMKATADGDKAAFCIDVIESLPSAQPGWIPCKTALPKNKSNVLTVIYIPGRQAYIRSGWYDDGLFMNDNGDTWKTTDKEVVGWMYQPKLPKPWKGGQDEQN